ncbi:MAG: NFYB/HAP3 family transcription factor subunit [Candidatus Aenigmarchaeota archaeon]|nr:NFYB/HAP3 family transcription factor subunit [Candidatus Aenigmarchaeota archaeon]
MISLLSLERVAKKTGIRRISKEALEELREIISEEGMRIAEKSVRLSTHANRRTVMRDDIRLAAGKERE